jgi:hypothetical protein
MKTLGSDHGSRYSGQFGGFYLARASALACRLSDRNSAFPPISQRIDRRAWITDDGRSIDDNGARFL